MASGPAGQVRFGLFMLLVLSLICAPFFFNTEASNAPLARQGVLDLGAHGALARPVSLEGQWQIKWQAPKVDGLSGRTPFPVRVPGVWYGQKTPGGVELPERGRAIYALTVKSLLPGVYRLYAPTIYSAHEIRIDGQKVAARGVLGDGPD